MQLWLIFFKVNQDPLSNLIELLLFLDYFKPDPCLTPRMEGRSYYGIPQQIMSAPRPSNIFLKNPNLPQPLSQEPPLRIPFWL